MQLYIGVDLAWGLGASRPANETGLVAMLPGGRIVAAGWVQGVAATLAWVEEEARSCSDVLVFVDASLVVNNPTGQRSCEKEVGQRYGRWKVSCNSTNQASPNSAGRQLLLALEERGFRYGDGESGPPQNGRVVSECYPYTTLVGVPELGYAERPLYKRKPKALSAASFRPVRAKACDDLVRRMMALGLDFESHEKTRELVLTPAPLEGKAYKHREDLLDAAICAWTAEYWVKWGFERCQVLGLEEPLVEGRRGTLIAPATGEQRGAARRRV